MFIVEPCKNCLVIATCKSQQECNKFKEYAYKKILLEHQCPICLDKNGPARFDFEPQLALKNAVIEDNDDGSKSAYQVVVNIFCEKCQGLFQYNGIVEVIVEETEEELYKSFLHKHVFFLTKETDPETYNQIYHNGHLDPGYSQSEEINHKLKGTWDEILHRIKDQLKDLKW